MYSGVGRRPIRQLVHSLGIACPVLPRLMPMRSALKVMPSLQSTLAWRRRYLRDMDKFEWTREALAPIGLGSQRIVIQCVVAYVLLRDLRWRRCSHVLLRTHLRSSGAPELLCPCVANIGALLQLRHSSSVSYLGAARGDGQCPGDRR